MSLNTRAVLAAVAITGLGLAAHPAQAQVSGSSTGLFTSVTGPGAVTSGLNTSDLLFGSAASNGTTVSPTANEFKFVGSAFSTDYSQQFTVGTFTFHNGSTYNNITGADLQTTLHFTAPGSLGDQTFTYDIPLTNTPNTGTAQQQADFITLPLGQPSTVFTVGSTHYTLQLSGFDVNSVDPTNGYLANNNTELHVLEGQTASANIVGTLTVSNDAPATAAPEPSTGSAFAFTALGAAALLLRARKRHATPA